MANETRYDVARMRSDMALRGWVGVDLATKAGLSQTTVSRFLREERQNPRTAKALAKALRRPVSRYLTSPIASAPARRSYGASA